MNRQVETPFFMFSLTRLHRTALSERYAAQHERYARRSRIGTLPHLAFGREAIHIYIHMYMHVYIHITYLYVYLYIYLFIYSFVSAIPGGRGLPPPGRPALCPQNPCLGGGGPPPPPPNRVF